MFKKFFLTFFSLILFTGCSVNPISTQKTATFDISDYQSFSISMSGASDEVRVSPFTASGLRDEFKNQLEALSLVLNEESPDVTFRISLAIEENERYRTDLYIAEAIISITILFIIFTMMMIDPL